MNGRGLPSLSLSGLSLSGVYAAVRTPVVHDRDHLTVSVRRSFTTAPTR